jgi:hypothetical protein
MGAWPGSWYFYHQVGLDFLSPGYQTTPWTWDYILPFHQRSRCTAKVVSHDSLWYDPCVWSIAPCIASDRDHRSFGNICLNKMTRSTAWYWYLRNLIFIIWLLLAINPNLLIYRFVFLPFISISYVLWQRTSPSSGQYVQEKVSYRKWWNFVWTLAMDIQAYIRVLHHSINLGYCITPSDYGLLPQDTSLRHPGLPSVLHHSVKSCDIQAYLGYCVTPSNYRLLPQDT